MTRAARGARTGLRILIAVVCLSALGAGVIAAPAMWARWMAHGRIQTPARAPARDVAIIFGAEMYPSGRPSPYLRARLDLGAALVAEGRVKVLIVSGDNADAHHRETSNMKDYLVSVGVPAARIVEDPGGLDTYDTCVRARDVFGVTSALLVSQRYHLPRAVATCRAVGVDAVGVGDVTVRRSSRYWDGFARRELAANVKMVWDLLTHRSPAVVDGPSDAVGTALRS